MICPTHHTPPASMATLVTTLTSSSSLPDRSNQKLTPAQKFKQEKESFLRNLDPYVAVGVLRKRNWKYNVDQETIVDLEDDYPAEELANLEKENWLRTFEYTYVRHPQWCYVRVYVLPDDAGHKYIPRSNKALRAALKTVMTKVDRSADAWDGLFRSEQSIAEDIPNQNEFEEESLYYIFNTLQNPEPRVEDMKDPYARLAMEQLLSSSSLPLSSDKDTETGQDLSVVGLKTPLYPYQGRSAALMVQREVQPAQMLDPRLQAFQGPSGREYYYDDKKGMIYKEKKLYSETCGGILAETMGCGKTLICLAVILATRSHVPAIPPLYREAVATREKCASLVEMAAAAAGQSSMPWKSHFDRLGRSGMVYTRCIKACEENRGAYKIPPPPVRNASRTSAAYPRPSLQRVRLTSGTLIVVPPNLVDHWEEQITRHTQGLKVLILRNPTDVTPDSDDLLQYDILLFSRSRFDQEAGKSVDKKCGPFKPTESPLLKLHWLRIIIDEGHSVAGSSKSNKTNTGVLLEQLRAERRWIVSGTPSRGLYGVEVSIASRETHTSDTDMSEATDAVLKRKKKVEIRDDDYIARLKPVVVQFFDLKPWSNPVTDQADWTTYTKLVGKDGSRRKVQSLRVILQSLVVRHRMDVIQTETTLPKLHNRVVYLEPTFYDRLNLNLFIFILAVNAITSEREGKDYMFDPKNKDHLSTLIRNLRQAGFWWATSNHDISGAVQNALEYMGKNRDRMNYNDIAMLCEGMQIAHKALASEAWNAFRQLNELGVYVQDFPDHARGLWALQPSKSDVEPLLMGISQACRAQQFVKEHLKSCDPAEGLAGAGIKARRELANATEEMKGKLEFATEKKTRKKAGKKSFSKGLMKSLPPDSPLAQTKLVATTSAKMTYLLNRVQVLHTEEKIIIFYDSTNSAVWIAEGLDLLGIEYRMYTSTLTPQQRSSYFNLFRYNEEIRVFLMDLNQASHGLHIANASRVFFVNPVWQPNIESQAIKRAHRIGQTRPVYVETLVLKDTLEDRMLKRRKAMSDQEMQEAEKDPLDDNAIKSIIQNEAFIPMIGDDRLANIAWLSTPSGFFDRHKLPIPDDEEDSETPRKRNRPSRNNNGSDGELDLVTPKRRRAPAGLEFLSPEGILMTPARQSHSPRSPSFVASVDRQNSGTQGASGSSTDLQQSSGSGSLFGPLKAEKSVGSPQ
ncbi:putative SNF2 family helicase [Aspergillus clavatus NRRL 1]|uniref:SNF2 family helicase, putative n=1 Tax=Aspergillus clavatus (strain ATCC 1007 / CBS 513.65 / DSM 816 / NCTC 3887 / NRRL 1 / QM 1276 / 107) TaxID=344612 RepID=A1CI23_ASPCL|nr:SNF2 family helicase, putative [Aspergillus clavatus NRRL 1]EAW10528.1 SNF2 family helicase, putative [Aspergillus clavatus NRRL 1]